eukprot:361415-Chlamydomonas_euryale.AAC.8
MHRVLSPSRIQALVTCALRRQRGVVARAETPRAKGCVRGVGGWQGAPSVGGRLHASLAPTAAGASVSPRKIRGVDGWKGAPSVGCTLRCPRRCKCLRLDMQDQRSGQLARSTVSKLHTSLPPPLRAPPSRYPRSGKWTAGKEHRQ